VNQCRSAVRGRLVFEELCGGRWVKWGEERERGDLRQRSERCAVSCSTKAHSTPSKCLPTRDEPPTHGAGCSTSGKTSAQGSTEERHSRPGRKG
jgi:hypothetical protein